MSVYRRRRRRKFNTSIEPAVAYENESVFMSGPVQQWPAIVHRHPLGPCAKPKTSWHQMHPETAMFICSDDASEQTICWSSDLQLMAPLVSYMICYTLQDLRGLAPYAGRLASYASGELMLPFLSAFKALHMIASDRENVAIQTCNAAHPRNLSNTLCPQGCPV